MLKVMIKNGRHIELYATTDDVKRAKQLARQAATEKTAAWVVDEFQNWKTIFSL